MNRSRTAAIVCASTILAGCGGFSMEKLWPWGDRTANIEQPRTPPGAKGYACDGGKRLLVNYAADGKYAMVIFPEREFRLDAVGSASGKYSNGRTTLSTDGNQAMLEEGSATVFANCKLQTGP